MRSGIQIPEEPGQWISHERLEQIKREVWQEAFDTVEAVVAWHGVSVRLQVRNPYG